MNRKRFKTMILSLGIIGTLGFTMVPPEASAQITKEATVLASEKQTFSSLTNQWGAVYDQRYKSIYFSNGYERLAPTITDTNYLFKIDRLYTYNYNVY